MATYKSPYNKGDKVQKVLSNLAAATIPGEKENQAREAERQAREECLASGGIWDSAAKVCRPRQKEQTQTAETKPKEMQPSPNPAEGTVEVFRNEKTGLPSGVTTPDGKTFLGLSPADVQKIADAEANKTALPQNAAPVGTARAAVEQQQRTQQLIQMAQQGLLTPQELQAIQGAQLDVSQALGAGAVGVLPGLIGGAAAGAAGGAVVGGVGAVPGAVIGAAAGALTSFLVNVRGNIKSQQIGQFQADQTALTRGQTMLRSLITDTNQNPQNAPENIELFYKTLNMIDAAHMKTWKDSQENLNVFLGNDGTEQLAKFEVFDSSMRQYYVNAFEAALIQPNPSQVLITQEDLTGEF